MMDNNIPEMVVSEFHGDFHPMGSNKSVKNHRIKTNKRWFIQKRSNVSQENNNINNWLVIKHLEGIPWLNHP